MANKDKGSSLPKPMTQETLEFSQEGAAPQLWHYFLLIAQIYSVIKLAKFEMHSQLQAVLLTDVPT